MSIYVSLLTAGTNSHEETSENANAVATDFVSEGVIGAITNTSGVAPATGAFAVNAQSTPDMTVAVSSGVAYVSATPSSQNSQTLRVRNSASSNVTISSNTSGSTKYDWVYIKVDAAKAAAPAVDADDVATLVTSRSSSSTSDNGTPPTYGYPIAVVTVANSASSITNANITDKRELATSIQDGSLAITNDDLSTDDDEPGAMTTYTPALTGSTTNPSIGSGTAVGQYSVVGKLVSGDVTITLDTGASAGSGTYAISLPVATDASYSGVSVLGTAWLRDASSSQKLCGWAIWNTTTTVNINIANSTSNHGGVTNASPWTWASGDSISISFRYFKA
jgi:hypothetical protein